MAPPSAGSNEDPPLAPWRNTDSGPPNSPRFRQRNDHPRDFARIESLPKWSHAASGRHPNLGRRETEVGLYLTTASERDPLRTRRPARHATTDQRAVGLPETLETRDKSSTNDRRPLSSPPKGRPANRGPMTSLHSAQLQEILNRPLFPFRHRESTASTNQPH